MDNSKKKKIIIAVVLALIIILFLWLVFRTSDQNTGNINGNNNEAPVFNAPSANFDFQPIEPSENDTEFSAVNLAKAYVARFGSWSTDNQGHNLQELIPLSTAAMANYLKSINLDYTDRGFSGVTTKSLSAEILNSDENSAVVLVNTQRINTKDDLSKETVYQEVEVSLLKPADDWLVDEVIWK